MKHPLSRCAPSPWKGDDSLTAGRPLLAVPGLGQPSFMHCATNLSRCAPPPLSRFAGGRHTSVRGGAAGIGPSSVYLTWGAPVSCAAPRITDRLKHHGYHFICCHHRPAHAGLSGGVCAGHLGSPGGLCRRTLSTADRLQGNVHGHRQLSADGRALLHPGRRADVGRCAHGRAAALCRPVRRPSARRPGLCQCAVADHVLGHLRLGPGRCGRTRLHDGQDDGQGRLQPPLCGRADGQHSHRRPHHSAIGQHDHLCAGGSASSATTAAPSRAPRHARCGAPASRPSPR